MVSHIGWSRTLGEKTGATTVTLRWRWGRTCVVSPNLYRSTVKPLEGIFDALANCWTNCERAPLKCDAKIIGISTGFVLEQLLTCLYVQNAYPDFIFAGIATCASYPVVAAWLWRFDELLDEWFVVCDTSFSNVIGICIQGACPCVLMYENKTPYFPI